MTKDVIQVYHGSDHIIQTPVYLGGRDDNDYGNGFYTTEFEDRAESWAALNGNPQKAIVNRYELNCDNLKILSLQEYGVLVWIAEVISHRGTNQETASILGSRLVEMYKIDTESYDIVMGYRADDSYTQVIEAFLLNQINVAEVERLFYKGELGNQIFLKSRKAFGQICWTGAKEIEPEGVYAEYDRKARREVNQFMQSRMKTILLDGYTVPGITAQYAVSKKLIYHREGKYYE